MADEKTLSAGFRRRGTGSGKRGKRGKRGHRGHRGHHGHHGHAGPGGPATSLVGPTSGDGVLICDEDIPAGCVIAAGGSAVLAVGDLNKYCNDNPSDNVKCSHCIINPFSVPPGRLESCGTPGVIGISSVSVPAGEPAQYVMAGPLTLPIASWDAVTDTSGGLVPNAIYYLSETTPGHLTTVKPTNGDIVQIGIAFHSNTLNVAIVPSNATGDGITILPSPTGLGGGSGASLTVIAYGYGRNHAFESDSETWQSAAPGSVLPGTPMSRNQSLVGFGQQSASAAAWLTAHVLGLSPGLFIDISKFISGGLFRLTAAQWDNVWTASDPNRGAGSGLRAGYPYYLSDVPGTFFLIDTTGTPPVGPGNWITKCFVALDSTTALIQIGDPRKVTTTATVLHTEDTSTTPLALTNNSDTEVLSCPSINPGAGNFVQVTGAVAIQLFDNTANTDVIAIVTLKEDGVEIARFSASPGVGSQDEDGDSNFFASIPVTWTFAAAAGPHVYSINVITDTTSDGTWTAQNRAMFVDVLSP